MSKKLNIYRLSDGQIGRFYHELSRIEEPYEDWDSAVVDLSEELGFAILRSDILTMSTDKETPWTIGDIVKNADPPQPIEGLDPEALSNLRNQLLRALHRIEALENTIVRIERQTMDEPMDERINKAFARIANIEQR